MNGIARYIHEHFSDLSLVVGIGALMLYMGYIMYCLARESGAGRLGTVVIFGALGLGLFGFIIKAVIQLIIDV